jgi:hypothetical protein
VNPSGAVRRITRLLSSGDATGDQMRALATTSVPRPLPRRLPDVGLLGSAVGFTSADADGGSDTLGRGELTAAVSGRRLAARV